MLSFLIFVTLHWYLMCVNNGPHSFRVFLGVSVFCLVFRLCPISLSTNKRNFPTDSLFIMSISTIAFTWVCTNILWLLNLSTNVFHAKFRKKFFNFISIYLRLVFTNHDRKLNRVATLRSNLEFSLDTWLFTDVTNERYFDIRTYFNDFHDRKTVRVVILRFVSTGIHMFPETLLFTNYDIQIFTALITITRKIFYAIRGRRSVAHSLWNK